MSLRKSPLADVHEARGARFTGFGGWEMPVEFDSIRTEHESVRESVGIFDDSHMGEIAVSGPDAASLLQRLTTNDVTALGPGEAQYSMITDEAGVILDDTLVYCLPERDDADYLFVPNAGHDEQMYDRWEAHREEWGLDAVVENLTERKGMVAVQGPDAADHVAAVAGRDVVDLGRFEAEYEMVEGVECLVARTGYTGEDGFELITPAEGVETVWKAFDCQPCGLGARDTLRLEAALLLSGRDFDPETNPRTPYEAGVGFSVKLDTEFVGRDALERCVAEGIREKLVGFSLLDRGVPRHGYEITDVNGESIGVVTSGTMSPTLGEPIGLGYVPVEYAEPGTSIRVVIRGEPKKAKIQATPFVR